MKEIHLEFQSVKSNFIETLTLCNCCCLRVVDLSVKSRSRLLVVVGDPKLGALLPH